jgi:DNA-binding response OmpR family regulator
MAGTGNGSQVEEVPAARALLTAASPQALDAVSVYLSAEGCQVLQCASTEDTLRMTSSMMPHVLIVARPALLDLLDLCCAIRRVTAAPLLAMGQRAGEEDEVLCLEYGADAYLGPGTSQRRLCAHLDALLRRGLHEVRAEVNALIQLGDVRVDLQRRRVYRGMQEIDLTQRESTLLTFLVKHAGRVVSRQALAHSVWGLDARSESRSLDVHIRWLRKKVEVNAANPQHIRTVRGIGYCFER